MAKKLSILLSLVILPNILGIIYDRMFRYAGNWLENYQNYFKIGFIVISIIGTGWLVVIAKKEKSYIWLGFSIILLILLLAYLYAGLIIINTSF